MSDKTQSGCSYGKETRARLMRAERQISGDINEPGILTKIHKMGSDISEIKDNQKSTRKVHYTTMISVLGSIIVFIITKLLEHFGG